MKNQCNFSITSREVINILFYDINNTKAGKLQYTL